jgi:hypothetical protein
MREDAELAQAIARQIATYNGQIFSKLSLETRSALISLAYSIIATVVRMKGGRNGEA